MKRNKNRSSRHSEEIKDNLSLQMIIRAIHHNSTGDDVVFTDEPSNEPVETASRYDSLSLELLFGLFWGRFLKLGSSPIVSKDEVVESLWLAWPPFFLASPAMQID